MTAMSDSITPIRVFISSPGDLLPERAVVRGVLDELNLSPVFRDRYKLMPYALEASAPPVVGLQAQEAVDSYLIHFNRFQPSGDLQGLTGSFGDADSLRDKLRYDLSLLLQREVAAQSSQAVPANIPRAR
jgi:hypothetical protein